MDSYFYPNLIWIIKVFSLSSLFLYFKINFQKFPEYAYNQFHMMTSL